jgi:hypothetical protein
MLALWPAMAPSFVMADRLVADDTVYVGRVMSALGPTVTFDFNCSGDIKTFELKEGWSIDIVGDCSGEQPNGIGGSEICKSDRAYGSFFVIGSLPEAGDKAFIYGFDYYSYDGERFTVGIDNEIKVIPNGKHSIKRIAGDYCAKWYGREFE